MELSFTFHQENEDRGKNPANVTISSSGHAHELLRVHDCCFERAAQLNVFVYYSKIIFTLTCIRQ